MDTDVDLLAKRVEKQKAKLQEHTTLLEMTEKRAATADQDRQSAVAGVRPAEEAGQAGQGGGSPALARDQARRSAAGSQRVGPRAGREGAEGPRQDGGEAPPEADEGRVGPRRRAGGEPLDRHGIGLGREPPGAGLPSAAATVVRVATEAHGGEVHVPVHPLRAPRRPRRPSDLAEQRPRAREARVPLQDSAGCRTVTGMSVQPEPHDAFEASYGVRGRRCSPTPGGASTPSSASAARGPRSSPTPTPRVRIRQLGVPAHVELHAGDGVVELAQPQRDLDLPHAVARDDDPALGRCRDRSAREVRRPPGRRW